MSFCGPCNQAKRKLGQVVVNKGSPHNTATSVALKKQKTERSESEQRLCDRYALQFMSQCILTLRAPSSSARCLLCACLNMRNDEFDHPSHSVTFPREDTVAAARAEALRKSKAGEDLSVRETKFMTGYSSQLPCSILVRPWSLVRLLEHAYL